MDEPATTDIRCYALWPILKQVLGRPADPQLQHAIASIDSWYADGCHRRDLTNHDNTKPGVYQHNDAITIMDAWYPQLLDAMFGPALGADAFGSLHGMLDFGAVNPGVPAAGGYPDFSDGWYGYVSKDLRDLLAPRHVAAAPARCRVVRRRVRRGRHVVTRRVRVCPHRAKRRGPPRPRGTPAPPAPASQPAGLRRAGRLLAHLLRRRVAGCLPPGAPEQPARRARHRPSAAVRDPRVRLESAGQLLRREHVHGGQRYLDTTLSVAEPPHLPAGRRAHPEARTLSRRGADQRMRGGRGVRAGSALVAGQSP
jgi:hypothetical protein